MRKILIRYCGVLLILALALVSCQDQPNQPPMTASATAPGVAVSLAKAPGAPPWTVYSTGFDIPRGLKFGPHGYLYVAEGGTGGTNSTVGQYPQVPAPVGPYTGGMTGRISKVGKDGVRLTVVDSLPSSQTAPPDPLISGVADVAFVDGTLYAIFAGAGGSHGVPSVPNGVIRVKKNGKWKLIANLSAFQQSHPVAHPEADDFEPDGTWYSMIAVHNELYAVEPNHGELDVVKPDHGKIRRIVDISASQGHIVPTAMVYRRGDLYVGNLHTFPIVDGSSSVYRISKGGKVDVWLTGFTTILGLAFDRRDRLYVLENTTGNPFPMPGTGKIIRINHNGDREEVATGLDLPTAMTFGPDGALYVSNRGFGFPPGMGEILRIDVGCSVSTPTLETYASEE